MVAMNGARVFLVFYHQKEPDKESSWGETEHPMGKEISGERTWRVCWSITAV